MIIKWILLGLLVLLVLIWIMNIVNIFLERLFWKIGKWYMLIALLVALGGCLYFKGFVMSEELELKNGLIFGGLEFICYYLVFPNLDDESHYEREIYIDFWDDVKTRTKEVFTPGWLSKLGGILGCLFVTILLFLIPWSPFIVFGIQAIFIIYMLWH